MADDAESAAGVYGVSLDGCKVEVDWLKGVVDERRKVRVPFVVRPSRRDLFQRVLSVQSCVKQCTFMGWYWVPRQVPVQRQTAAGAAGTVDRARTARWRTAPSQLTIHHCPTPVWFRHSCLRFWCCHGSGPPQPKRSLMVNVKASWLEVYVRVGQA
jgi:hypothetical protein